MTSNTKVTAVVPLLMVSNMDRSLTYYVAGLGFQMENKWVVDGAVRWCWLTRAAAAIMLQELTKERLKSGEVQRQGGISLWFQCDDAIAIYRELRSREVDATEPEVGNGMWYTSLADPDDHRLHFTSAADHPEDTKLSDAAGL